MPEPNTTTENEGPESETNLYKDQWMIRPCSFYKSEYNDCSCMQARFHQYFVYGEYLDCTQWKIDYDNCYAWEKYKSKEAYDELIKSEKQHRVERLQGHYNNDVWERREGRPENWNCPLPDWLQERAKTSYLTVAKEKLQNELEKKKEYNIKATYCILM
ncbi:synaptic plasticity regulator PANTS [Megachile rotundata]|uniref:synaptic plasticity regulator PANTS n=1 Tax=Megachile rotundata TaxID=143995 RepID=UPI000258E22D|nr:PREDICTED: UPF0545 protein C22orf39 homolog [Megachile rotundata]